ncbi:magnesium transporter [Pyruvatibacter mobilis]|uniref:magnesium transporter n=1 Tax=Pyruvatibacter mobilis TaxID=1712261 RepID=UPI003BAF1B2E
MSDTAAELDRNPEDDLGLSPDFVRTVVDRIDAGDAPAVRKLTADLHPSDLAELIELLRPDERRTLVAILGPDFDLVALSELDEGLRDELLSHIGPGRVAEALADLDTDDAVYLLEDMGAEEQRELLDRMPEEERTQIERSLEYDEDSAGRLMQRDIVVVPPHWSVGQTIDHMRESVDLPETFFEIFVVDEDFHAIGTVPLSRIMRTKRPVKISDIMDMDQTLIPAAMDQEEVAYQFEKYNLVSAAVVDEEERLVGMVTVDDVVEVIQEEAGEDIRRLAGVGDEALTDTVIQTARSRFPWLFANLFTAAIAAIVISAFGVSIEKMVTLAILMPVVAALAGNAGTQTMTVTVRAMATRDLVEFNVRRVISREVLVAFLNGIIFAILMGIGVGFIFGDWQLSGVIAVSMVITLGFAGLSGILIPLALDRAGADPAISSSVFLIALTDAVSFLAFLGLATWLLL